MRKEKKMDNLELIVIGLFGVIFIVGIAIIIVDQMEKKKKEKIFDEEHALDQALNAMLEDFSEEEIEEIIKDHKKDKEDGV